MHWTHFNGIDQSNDDSPDNDVHCLKVDSTPDGKDQESNAGTDVGVAGSKEVLAFSVVPQVEHKTSKLEPTTGHGWVPNFT